MYLIPIAWIYVALMMAVAEATNSNGTVLGAIVTFTFYGLLPVGLILYFIGTPSRSGLGERGKQLWRPKPSQSSQIQAANRPLTRSRR
jgi:hypothetical protein